MRHHHVIWVETTSSLYQLQHIATHKTTETIFIEVNNANDKWKTSEESW